jgi:hypothetical protein
MWRRQWILLLPFLLLGCAQFALTGGVTNEAEAIAIAKRAVAAKDNWDEATTFEVKRGEGGWVVIAWHEPRTPGSYRFVFIDPSGNVTGYVRGD